MLQAGYRHGVEHSILATDRLLEPLALLSAQLMHSGEFASAAAVDEIVIGSMAELRRLRHFGLAAGRPFRPDRLQARADGAWRAAGLERLTLHDCRHTFASLMIAAGVNAKALSNYMGHSSIAITFDRYGKLMPGNEAQAAGLLDAYLEAQTG